jgi:hypothetical protein
MYNGGGVPFPVRGNISVARNGCACGPNPREGIHGSPRITRIYTCDVVCGGLRGVRAHGAVCVPQTQRCSLEVPLDAARCRYSVHWREGGSARRCASRNDVPRTGRKREKMGGGDGVTGNGAPFPAAHLFPSPHPAMHVIPPPTIGGGGIPSSPVSAVTMADSPPMTDV